MSEHHSMTANRCVLVLVMVTASCARQPLHAATAPPPAGPDLARWVNPLIGTSHGETWPGADLPFGMVQWSPENTRGQQMRTARPGGYAWDAPRIRGFALTHMSGTGCAGAYGDIPFF